MPETIDRSTVPNTELRECPETSYKSLYSSTPIAKGQVISPFGAKETLDRPNYLTLQMGDRQHIMLDPELLQYINHSCDPNVFFDTQAMQVVALRNIEPGEELTFFYPSTEWSMDRAFDCVCQSDRCLKKIQGAAHLPLDVLRSYRLTEHIQEKLLLRLVG